MATVTYLGRVDGARSDSVNVDGVELPLNEPVSVTEHNVLDCIDGLADVYAFDVQEGAYTPPPPPEPPQEPEGSSPENE